MDFEQKTYYLIGIGGIGMSSLAHYLLLQGHAVYGYDKTPTKITDQLSKKGVSIVFDASLASVPENALSKNVSVIYTAAIPNTHPQLSHFQKQGNRVMKRAVFLGKLCLNTKTLAVAGTHGKTTTSAILAHMFYKSKQSFSAFLGGIVNDYDTNFISTGTEFTIVEADEFDRSFLTLYPQIASITSMDVDHLDIYHTKENLTAAFNLFSNQVSGTLIHAFGLPLKGLTYALENKAADYSITNIRLSSQGYLFDVNTPQGIFDTIKFKGFGDHNLQNALCALAMADQAGLPFNACLESLASFPGVHRRMNIYPFGSRIFIDDYAHHPTEILAVLDTMTRFYPNQIKAVIFQPHLFSRTKDFMDDFAQALSRFDRIMLLDIYPARELPIAGINAKTLLDRIENDRKELIQKETLLDHIQKSDAGIFAVLGAGDIGVEMHKIINHFSTRL